MTNNKVALFVSPHLDDVVFSCGATLARMSADGWQTILCTIFTKSVPNPSGFALACQLDKNLSAEIDYMQLRRAEDRMAGRLLKAGEIFHLSLPEAPHRGYHSAFELFAGIKPGDEICGQIAEHLELINFDFQPSIVFAPQGLGNHCDHLQTIDAVSKVFAREKIFWYRDTPYAIRQPEAKISDKLPFELSEFGVDVTETLALKTEASAAYATQINFQFGGRDELTRKLADFHAAESQRLNLNYAASEAFLFDARFDLKTLST